MLPEAFARDFGEPGSDLAPYAETLDGPFASALRELSAAPAPPGWPACSRWPTTRTGR